MLPTGFANLAADRSPISDTIQLIDNWCQKHEELSAIDPRRLAKEQWVSPITLTEALLYLVDSGILRLVYRFETPQGYLLPDNYETEFKVPGKLQDRFDNPVNRWDGEIVPVFISGDRAES